MGVYERLGVRRVINALGISTNLGGSLIPSEVLKAMDEAAASFVDLNELLEKAGEIIAKNTGAEAAYVTSGAAAGIVLATAACMTGQDLDKMKQLPNTEGLRNEVIIQKRQMVYPDGSFPCGTYNVWAWFHRVPGGRIIEVGDEVRWELSAPSWGEREEAFKASMRRQIEEAINEKTAAIAYYVYNRVKEDDPTEYDSMEGVWLPLEEVIEIAHKHGVPVIVNAAAELPPVKNLKLFIEQGADLVIFSGGKDIAGPNDTGIILGRRDLIKSIALQACPNIPFIGRPMKVSKEQIVGLVTALQLYVNKDWEAEFKRWEAMDEYMIEELDRLPGVKAERFIPRTGERPLCIPRVLLSLDEKTLGMTTTDVLASLGKGDPYIVVDQQLSHEGKIIINPQCLVDGEERVIVQRLKDTSMKKG